MTPSDLKTTCLADCTDAQRQAIEHIDGPLLVLAGPGSGKTRVITRRIAYLTACGVPPHRILAITFTNKAAGEMRERVEALGVGGGVSVATFHSFCARMLRVYARHLGLTENYSIYDTSDSLAAVKRAVQDLDLDPSTCKPKAVLRSISNAKNALETPEDVAKHDRPDAGDVSRVYQRYCEILRECNAMDFDDLLLKMVDLLHGNDEVAGKLRRRFDYVLVDEYQDTNRAQYLIATNLAREHRNFCATGDPDQSIYGWRGADINNILDFEHDYPDTKTVRLEQNYRSTKRILQAASGVIANNMARKHKDLWTDNSEGDPVNILRAEDENQEARDVAEDIARRVRSGDIAPKDVAIFYRVNAQSRVLENAMRRETLPYAIVAGTAFYQRAEVKDLMAYLKLIQNPDDDVAVARVANVPGRKLGNVSLNRVRHWAQEKGVTLMQGLERIQEAGARGGALKGATEFLGVLRKLREMPTSPVALIVEELMDLIAYEMHLRRQDDPEDRIANARELINAAAEYDREEPEGGLAGFLERSALISDTDRWDDSKGCVTLMTLHAAKGLEFPAVYVVGLEQGLLPLESNGAGFAHNIEEERRLLFVGMTRAMKRLTLSFAECRARYGKREYTEPSQFLAEIPEDVTGGKPDLSTRPMWRPSVVGGGGGAGSRPAAPADSFRRVQRSATEEIVYDGDIPDVEGPGFKPGDYVEHATYGRGKVLEVSGFGENARARVQFAIVGVKRLVLKYAGLRKV